MQLRIQGLALIKRFEGFSAVVYKDVAGLDTVGYGHLIRRGESFSQPLTETEAEKLLRCDVKIAENAVSRLIHAPISQNQFDALVSFTFNLGAGALQRSTLRQKLNREEYVAARHEFGRWIWANGLKYKGLINRRAAEAILYST